DRADVLTGDELRQPTVLLLVGGEVAEIRGQDVVLHPEAHARRPGPEELFGEDLVEPIVGDAHSAVGLRQRPADQPMFAGGAPGPPVRARPPRLRDCPPRRAPPPGCAAPFPVRKPPPRSRGTPRGFGKKYGGEKKQTPFSTARTRRAWVAGGGCRG